MKHNTPSANDTISALSGKVALITGAAHRIGATTARMLHAEGMNIIIHYRSSRESAQALQKELNAKRKDSVILIQADLLETAKISEMVRQAVKAWGQLDVVVNNASSFYPTPVGKIDEKVWDDLIGSNLKVPLFLSQAAAPHLKKTKGCIVNIIDIHADRPLKNHTVYCIAKAGLVMLTKSLARELGPEIRVNAVAPGAILWPENDMDDLTKKRIVSSIVLKRHGEPEDIAKAVRFLVMDAGYMSGQVLTVDGGRTLTN